MTRIINYRRYSIWILLFIVFLLVTGFTRGEERNIYVGDLITLRISSSEYTLENLREKFSEFEIVNIQEEKEAYQLTLRSFEPGEYRVILGNKELLIVVNSTLEDLDRDNIFIADPHPLESSYNPYWQYVFSLLFIIFLLIVVISIWQFIKRKKEKTLSPYEDFRKKILGVDFDSGDFFVELTFLFKEYLENTFNCKLKGKTSEEILREMKKIPILKEKLLEIREWLAQADYYKYTGLYPTREIREKQMKLLKELVAEIEDYIQVSEG